MSGKNDQQPICYTDVETFGLESDRHDVFEFGSVKVYPDGREEELHLWLPADVSKASPDALRKNRFFERRVEGYEQHGVDGKEGAWRIAEFTSGATLAGNRISFDEGMVSAYLRKHGLCHAWNLYTVDVPTFCAGALGLRGANFNGKTVSELLGVLLPSDEDRHTAMGDVRWSRRMHEAAIELVQRRESALLAGLEELMNGWRVDGEAVDRQAVARTWAQQLAARLKPQTQKVA